MTVATSATLGARVWGQPTLEVHSFDDTGTTLVPTIPGGGASQQNWYIAHDQATAAADTSLDLVPLFDGIGIGILQRCFLSVRSPDGDPITVDLYRDGSYQATLGTFSSDEWLWIDLGVVAFSQEDALAGVPSTLRLHGGLSHSSFLLLVPRAIYYEAENEPGADVTATDALSYAFNGEETRRDNPWDLSPADTILFGPVTPTIAPNTIDDEWVQVVGFWEQAPGETNNPELILIADGSPAPVHSVVIAGTTSPTLQNQTVAVAQGDPMGAANTIFGTGVARWGRGAYFTQGVVLEIGITAGWPIDNDVPVRLDAVALARPVDNPFFTNNCEGDTYPLGSAFEVAWDHIYPGLIVSYEISVIDTLDWSTVYFAGPVTSPQTIDTSALVEGGVYWVMIRAFYDDGSFGWSACEFTVGAEEYGPVSLAKSGISM